jgi:hypothetical protein
MLMVIGFVNEGANDLIHSPFTIIDTKPVNPKYRVI